MEDTHMNNIKMISLIEKVVNVKGERSFLQELCWGELYDECIKGLRGLERGLKFHVEWDNEDFEQDVMIEIFKCLDKYNPNCGSFYNWLRAIAKNVYNKNYYRNEKCKGIETIPMYVENEEKELINIIDVCKCTNSIEEEYFENVNYREICDVINTLDEKYRQVVILSCIYGLKPREVARQLGIDSGVVRVRLSRARSKLKTLIGGNPMREFVDYEYEL